METTEEMAFREQMDRLLAADVVLVAYPVLSQEASEHTLVVFLLHLCSLHACNAASVSWPHLPT